MCRETSWLTPLIPDHAITPALFFSTFHIWNREVWQIQMQRSVWSKECSLLTWTSNHYVPSLLNAIEVHICSHCSSLYPSTTTRQTSPRSTYSLPGREEETHWITATCSSRRVTKLSPRQRSANQIIFLLTNYKESKGNPRQRSSAGLTNHEVSVESTGRSRVAFGQCWN